MQPLIWFVGQRAGGSTTLAEALAMDFTVRECSRLSDVWREMLGAQPGIVVVDATGSARVSSTDHRNIAALCSVAPVVVLIDDPSLAQTAADDYPRASVLFEPLADTERVRRTLTDLSRQAILLEFPALMGVF
jgi:hypothetical protein